MKNSLSERIRETNRDKVAYRIAEANVLMLSERSLLAFENAMNAVSD